MLLFLLCLCNISLGGRDGKARCLPNGEHQLFLLPVNQASARLAIVPPGADGIGPFLLAVGGRPACMCLRAQKVSRRRWPAERNRNSLATWPLLT